MRNTVIVPSLLCILALWTASCATSGSMTRTGQTEAPTNLQDITFTVESLEGQVQVKANRNEPWHNLKVGEVFNGFAFVRSGFHSEATLIMEDGDRKMRCKIDGLLCSMSIRDIFDKLLCPSGITEYNNRLWDKDESLERDQALLICRNSLNGKAEPSLLAEAGALVDMRSMQQGGGAAGAASGGAGGGAGGGGCGGGG